MRITSQTLFLLALLAITCSASTQLYLLSSSTRARCLDGSYSGYYFQPGSGSGSEKFLIFIEGGYYCVGQTRQDILSSCYDRSSTDLGSSNSWPKSFRGIGIISDVESENPAFFNWNKAYIKYCDGTYYESSAEPITFKDKTLYFRGSDNMKEILSELIARHGLSQSSTAVLGGVSAGGQAAFYWSQYVRELLPSSVKMMTISDCGLNVEVNDELQRKNKSFVDLITDGDRSIIQPQGCPYLYDDDNLYKCFFQEYIMDLVPVPVLFVSSLYDQFFLEIYLKVTCIYGRAFLYCNEHNESSIILLRSKLLTLIDLIRVKRPDWAVWAISCIKHVILLDTSTYNNVNFEVPCNSSFTSAVEVKNVIDAFERGQAINNLYRVDEVTYPNNAPCSFLSTVTRDQF